MAGTLLNDSRTCRNRALLCGCSGYAGVDDNIFSHLVNGVKFALTDSRLAVVISERLNTSVASGFNARPCARWLVNLTTR
jgi:hypothetical protein